VSFRGQGEVIRNFNNIILTNIIGETDLLEVTLAPDSDDQGFGPDGQIASRRRR
jgi:hypothetical protein